MASNIYEALKEGGVNVRQEPGWWTHSRPYKFYGDAGIMNHHTAGYNDLHVVRDGRRGLPGPLAHLYISRKGVVSVISKGYCNHAGRGMNSVLKDSQSGKAPDGDASKSGFKIGNKYYYGIEIEGGVNGKDDFTDVQIDQVILTNTALCRWKKWSANRCILHREWTSRKIDPSWNIDIRAEVRAKLGGDNMAGQWTKIGDPLEWIDTWDEIFEVFRQQGYTVFRKVDLEYDQKRHVAGDPEAEEIWRNRLIQARMLAAIMGQQIG